MGGTQTRVTTLLTGGYRFFLALALFCVTLASCSAFNQVKGGAPLPPETGAPAPVLESSNPSLASKPPEKESRTGSQPEPDATQEKLDELNARISILEQNVAQLEAQSLKTARKYSDPKQLYQQARTLLLKGDTKGAAALFNTLARDHSTHSLADNAMYWLGECHYTSGEYEKAAEVFKKLVIIFPKADKVPDALLKTGYSYLSMDDVNRADHYLKKVIKRYPFSPAAEKAQKKMKTIN